jgi:hypothetical protein
MKLAARTLFHLCRNDLTTDLGWPGYHDILLAEARRANRAVTVVPIRHAVMVEPTFRGLGLAFPANYWGGRWCQVSP